jgi:hypothetical protein
MLWRKIEEVKSFRPLGINAHFLILVNGMRTVINDKNATESIRYNAIVAILDLEQTVCECKVQ